MTEKLTNCDEWEELDIEEEETLKEKYGIGVNSDNTCSIKRCVNKIIDGKSFYGVFCKQMSTPRNPTPEGTFNLILTLEQRVKVAQNNPYSNVRAGKKYKNKSRKIKNKSRKHKNKRIKHRKTHKKYIKSL
jgi:hypothetical protein